MRLVLIIIILIPLTSKGQELFMIPAVEKNVFQLIDTITRTKSTSFHEFEISNEISLMEYWEFVEDHNYQTNRQSSLPDKLEIPYMLLYELKKDSAYPAFGISWSNAMEYCKWRTFQEQDTNNLKYIFRLPTLSEWLYAYSLKDSIDGLSNFNTSLSEWTLNTKDESFYFGDYIWHDYIYFSKVDDPDVLQRKVVIGDSWLYELDDLKKYMTLDFYEKSSYSHIGFRIVKIPLDIESNSNSINQRVINEWTQKSKR